MKKFVLIVEIIAVWILASADYVVPIKNMYGPAFYENLKNLSLSQANYGAYMIFVLPFVALGLGKLMKGIHLKGLVPITYFFVASVMVCLHTSYIYYYHVSRRLAEHPELQSVIDDFDKFKNFVGTVYIVGLLVLSLVVFAYVAMGRSIYPKKFAVINPLTGILVLSIFPNMQEPLYFVFIPATFFALMITTYLMYEYRVEE